MPKSSRHIRNIVQYPAAVLRQVASSVGAADDVRDVARWLGVTLAASGGIGLAAPQIGISLRIIHVDIGYGGVTKGGMTLVNPEIISTSSGERQSIEGCLSLTGRHVLVSRPEHITVRYREVSGVERELSCTGLTARCVQHEIDHLDGVLIIDREPPPDPAFNRGKLFPVLPTPRPLPGIS